MDPQASQMLTSLLFFLLFAGVPIFLFLRRRRRMLKIGPIYSGVLTLLIVLVLWGLLESVVEMGRR
jgi:hypothetical protein